MELIDRGSEPDVATQQADARKAFDVMAAGGVAILPLSVTVAELANPTAATIPVEGRCHVEVILADPAEADNVQALDASGAIVDCAVLRRNSTSMTTDLALHAGRSGVFVLSERATVLQLRRGEVLVRSVSLQLQPGQTTTIQ